MPPGKCRQKALHLAGGGAENMQPVAKLAFLDVADKAVDAGDRLGGGGVGGQADVLGDARLLRLDLDIGDEAVAARRVQPVGGRIFIEQPFEPQQRRRGFALRHGRGQVA